MATNAKYWEPRSPRVKVGRPSLKKSPAISPAEKRVRAIETRERERLSAEVESIVVDQLLFQASVKAIKARIGKSMKTDSREEARSLALERMAVEGTSPPVPSMGG